MKKTILVVILAVVGLVLFIAGLRTGSLFVTRHQRASARRLHAMQKHPVACEHEPTGLTLSAAPSARDDSVFSLTLMRGSETFTLPSELKEDSKEFVAASATNSVFVLVKTRRDKNGYDYARLVRVLLPQPSGDLESAQVDTLFTMDDLKPKKGRSWINGIEGVTPDGKKLLLSRSFPYDVTSSGSRWQYRKVIYDVETGKFASDQFEKGS